MSKNRFLICVGLCLLVAIPLTVAATYRKLMAKTTPPGPQVSQENTQDPSEVPQGLLFELRPSGFIPTETEISAGKYMLLLENRSGAKDLHFSLERENHGRVAQSPEHRRDWAERLQLTPGTYVLSEAEHPEWKAVIRVTPR